MKTSQKIRSIDYETISDFTMTIRYDETDPSIPISHKPRHIHATCEILIHISGDICPLILCVKTFFAFFVKFCSNLRDFVI